MEFFWEMLSLQETMFLLILTGVLIKKLKIIDAAGRKMLSDLLIDVILPCNIVESFLGGMVFPDGFARNCLLAVGLSAVIQLMSIYGSKLLFRKYPREQRSVLSYGIICSNSSFVGLPVARLLFGDLGVIYTSMFQIPLRFTMWTAGLSLFTSVSRKDAFRKLVRHPCIIAVFAGLLLMAAPVSLPGFLDSAVASVSSCTVPVSMFVIGTILADAPIRSMFSKPVLWYTCLRLVLYPLLLCVLLKPLHLDTTLTNVCILMTGMPAGSTGSILADKYDCDAVFASQIAFASTLCSILTIPLLTLVMEEACTLAGPAAAGRRDPKNRLHEQSVFCWVRALSGPPRKGRQSRRLDAEGGLPLFLGLIRLAPVPHGVQNGFQAVPQVGQRVFHAGRDLRIDRTGQQAAPLHLPELGRQHFLADRADGLLQFSKTLCPRHQIPENEHLPLVTDQRQRGFHRTGRKFFCRGCHLQVPPVYRSLQIL